MTSDTGPRTFGFAAPRAGTVQRSVLGGLVVWTLVIHTVLVGVTGFSAWRLGGFAMYGEPGSPYLAASVVACDSGSSCRAVRDGANGVLSHVRTGRRIPVFSVTRRSGRGRGQVDVHHVMDAPEAVSRRWSAALKAFRTFPTQDSATGLVALLGAEACPRRCVVFHHRQRVSLLRGRAAVESRPFEVVRGSSSRRS